MKIIFVLLSILIVGCQPVTRNITSEMIDGYHDACKEHGGIIVVYPENWILTARVICNDGTVFRFEGDKAISKYFMFMEN